jgi:aspartate racemase
MLEIMKTIGLIGGMSWESSVEYYRLINQGMKARLGGHNNARSLMVTVNFDEIAVLQREGRWEELGAQMAHAARQLEGGGADFILLCTNTMHKLTPNIESAVKIPFLHIADATAKAIKSAGMKKVGLLGTRFTMEDEFYRERLESRHGIGAVIPNQEDRAVVHRIIYDELCHGTVLDSSRKEYQRIIEWLKVNGCEGVVLGCTEITLLIKPADSSLPVFDTTQIHAAQAVELAVENSA